jgi:hypothetical protein
MIRTAAKKVAWVGRTASMVFGLALVLGLLFGAASMAFGANGGNFILGQNNTATLLTKLTGNVNGAAMQVVNNNADANDTALSLSVQAGEAPMRVNSSTQVSNLNADFVDGRSASSFVANSTYRLGQGQERLGEELGDGSKVLSQSCLPGDRMLSGGPASVNAASDVLDSFARDTNTWQARINDSAVAEPGDSFTVAVLCADQ